ncbi:hypothetical protein O988_00580 [Pseudogymnoascus sp. VKM F-3808]|nr:hypothetical protein O988_00580 [Pseudogymnoascus sp. VKM F-3808]
MAAKASDKEIKMEYTRLGKSGLNISKLILGGMSYGSSEWWQWVLNEEAALPLLKHAYDAGITTWDTADMYSNGESERIIGKALTKYNIPRNRVVILTKCYFGVADPEEGQQRVYATPGGNVDPKWVNRIGLSRKHIFDAVDASVERLGTYIDVLQIHRLDHETPREEIMKALNDVVESGKVRYIGASSMAAWEFQTLQNIADKNGWHKFISMQNYYNLLYREEEREMIPYCKDTGVGLIPWSPMARGALARPYDSRSTVREGSDNVLTGVVRKESETDKIVVGRVQELAEKLGVSMARIAIAWALQKGTNPIVGLSSKERIDEAVEAVKWQSGGGLTEEDCKYLDDGYAPKHVKGFAQISSLSYQASYLSIYIMKFQLTALVGFLLPLVALAAPAAEDTISRLPLADVVDSRSEAQGITPNLEKRKLMTCYIINSDSKRKWEMLTPLAATRPGTVTRAIAPGRNSIPLTVMLMGIILTLGAQRPLLENARVVRRWVHAAINLGVLKWVVPSYVSLTPAREDIALVNLSASTVLKSKCCGIMSPIDTDSAAGVEGAVFDFVVVGGGTSGLVVANRLTEDPDVQVLVLEAGTNRLDDPRLIVPGLGIAAFEDPDFDWNFSSSPQEQLNGRQLPIPLGRTLGGSSAINMGMVVYPSKVGMDAWEKLGNPGWGWEGLSPYIRKFHKAAAPSDEVSFGDQYMPYHGAWFKTFKALGYPQVEDPIKGSGVGPFVNPGAVDPITHTRSHAGAAYFGDSIRSRPNLRVITGALVEKLISEKRRGLVVATAVQVRKDGNTHMIPVQKEVILAAGVTHSPQILELSGIGNGDLLRSHGIESIVNNPGVGENLQDHGYVSFSYEVADGLPSGDMAQDPAVAAAAMAAYQKDGSGPLGMVGLVSAFMPCLDFPSDERAQLLQMLDIHSGGEISPGQKKQFDALRQILQDPNEPTAQYILSPFQVLPREAPSSKGVFGLAHGRHPGFFISIGSLLSYPFSRGSVHLASNDPKRSPIIDSGILRHPVHLELQARHSIWMEKIAETEPMASILKTGGARLHTTERLTDVAKAKELCKELSLSIFHLCGTCAMLPREDGGVVDSKLKVYGTLNVRIVDASLFPLEPRGNLQATVFAVAEKGADIIKQNV